MTEPHNTMQYNEQNIMIGVVNKIIVEITMECKIYIPSLTPRHNPTGKQPKNVQQVPAMFN